MDNFSDADYAALEIILAGASAALQLHNNGASTRSPRPEESDAYETLDLWREIWHEFMRLRGFDKYECADAWEKRRYEELNGVKRNKNPNGLARCIANHTWRAVLTVKEMVPYNCPTCNERWFRFTHDEEK